MVEKIERPADDLPTHIEREILWRLVMETDRVISYAAVNRYIYGPACVLETHFMDGSVHQVIYDLDEWSNLKENWGA